MSKEKPDDRVVACAEFALPWKARLEILLTGKVSVQTDTPIDVFVLQDGAKCANSWPGTARIDTNWPRVFRRPRGALCMEKSVPSPRAKGEWREV